MKHHLLTTVTLLVAAQLCMQSGLSQQSPRQDDVNDASQFQLRAPINSTPPAVNSSNPGADNYRSVAPFPKEVERNLLANPGAANNQPVDKLTSIIGANAQMTIHTEKDISLGLLQGLLIDIQNGTDRPLVFDGDKATAKVGTVTLTTASVQEVDNAACPPKTASERFIHATKASIVAGATIGAIPAERDMKIQAGPVPERYGCDEARRVDEQSRFGKRILWPGDTTTGILYFNTANSLQGASIEMPVNSMFDSGDNASITKVR